MNFLITESDVSTINSDSIGIVPEIPKGIYKTTWDKFRGTYLEKTEIKLSHGKIYGSSQKIADHIVEAYKLIKSDKNLGVLLSGEKGLGKTLTARLVLEKLASEKPIILISEYQQDLPDFLSNVKNCVILMDEFEKFMSGKTISDDEDSQTKQETILSVLDGNSSCCGNLFLLTVNNVLCVDDNFKSRPGRIKYHYRFKSEIADTVREYCADNLKNKDLTEEIVKVLGATKFVSLDIISAFVEELNNFPETKPEDVIKFFNVENSSETMFVASIKVVWDDKYEFIYKNRSTLGDILGNQWYSISPMNGKIRSKIEELNIEVNLMLSINEGIEINPYGITEINPLEINIDESFLDIGQVNRIKILGGTIKDAEIENYMRKYNPQAI